MAESEHDKCPIIGGVVNSTPPIVWYFYDNSHPKPDFTWPLLRGETPFRPVLGHPQHFLNHALGRVLCSPNLSLAWEKAQFWLVQSRTMLFSELINY